MEGYNRPSQLASLVVLQYYHCFCNNVILSLIALWSFPSAPVILRNVIWCYVESVWVKCVNVDKKLYFKTGLEEEEKERSNISHWR